LSKVLIIAEAGVNHNGDMELAKKLVDAAADAGADYVKFQTYKTDALLLETAEKAGYQKKIMGESENQYEMLKKLELCENNHVVLIEHCESRNVKFLSSPFDLDSIDLIAKLNLDFIKVPSGEITNFPYIRKVGGAGKKILLSTGMSNLGEIEAALNLMVDSGADMDQISVMHCNTEYPTPPKDANLRAISTIQNAFNVKVGYSDHTLGVEAAIAAVSMGATVIEKHITLDKNMSGPDHMASMDPEDFKQFVQCIHNVEAMLGGGLKRPSQSEKKNITIARKSIVASKAISKGEPFGEGNLTTKRPGDGVSPMRWNDVVGKVAHREYSVDEKID